MATFSASFHLILSIILPPIEFSCSKYWLKENFRSRKTQKVKGLKVTRKIKTVKQNFCIKKTQKFTIIASLREQLIILNKKQREGIKRLTSNELLSKNKRGNLIESM